MPSPGSAARFAAALRAEGLKVVEYDGWETHNRNHIGPWGPVHGAMLHHTVTGPKVNGVRLCHDGYVGLPGPLCHGVIRRNGEVHLVGWGRTNHAGGGDPDVLQAVIDERYLARPPVPRVGNKNGVDGNRHFIGFECENLGDGEDPWPAVQVDAMVRASAAVCRMYGWTYKSMIEHQEWSADKSDPRGPGYPGGPAMRERVAKRLEHPASGPVKKPPTTTPKPGGTMAEPNHMHLTRGEDVTLIPGSPYTVYWDGEQADEGNQHGAGNKTLALAGTTYALDVYLSFAALDATQHVAVKPIEEGTPEISWGDVVDLTGADTGSQLTLGAHFTGTVRPGKTLAIQLINMSDTSVTLTYARLSGLFWTD